MFLITETEGRVPTGLPLEALGTVKPQVLGATQGGVLLPDPLTPTPPSYLQTSSLLASDHHLTEEERKHFCQEILSFASRQTDGTGQTCSSEGFFF